MPQGEELQRLVGDLGVSTWTYAALGALIETGLLERLAQPTTPAQLAQQTGLDPLLVAALIDMGAALGLVHDAGKGIVSIDGTAEFLRSPVGEGMRLFLQSDFLQAGDVVRRARAGTLRPGWHYTDPDILNAQGRGSGTVMEQLCREVVPQLGGLSERLSAPSAAFLDVGSGVGGICITLARLWPNLRVVGLEPAESPLAEAHRNISASGVADRIEIRPITLEELTDVDAFDAGWLPQVFLPFDVLQRSLGPFHRSIKPGGWAIVFTLSSPGAELRPSLARFRNVLWGGEPLSPESIAELLAHAGFSDLRVEAAGGIPGAKLVLGRKVQQNRAE